MAQVVRISFDPSRDLGLEIAITDHALSKNRTTSLQSRTIVSTSLVQRLVDPSPFLSFRAFVPDFFGPLRSSLASRVRSTRFGFAASPARAVRHGDPV